MSNSAACSLVMDGCGLIILLLFLLPQFSHSYGKGVNRHKRRLLNDAAVIHFFGLLISFAGTISWLIGTPDSVRAVYSAITTVLEIISAVFTFLCVCCSENGVIRIPRGRNIPVGQIICAVLPPAFAACLMTFLPEIRFMGIAWAIALHMINSLIMIDSEKHLTATEQQLNRTQAAQLSMQMQPHFIFNTLSAIHALCLTDPQIAAESIENLSGYLRGNLESLNMETLIPFNTELRHIQQYVALEMADPSRQFKFDYELDIRDFSLPALTVQPIVENAVKHGALTHRDGTGHVLLSTEVLGDFIRIIVADNGKGTTALTGPQQTRHAFGIENTRKRLEVLCGGSIQITTGEDGTKVIILIPRKKD